MNREQAESLLALLVFDELEEPTRTELLEYLKTDPELNERLGDMRVTAKLLGEAVTADDAPKLDTLHRDALTRGIERDRRKKRGVIRFQLGTPIPPAIAALLLISTAALLVALLMPATGASRRAARQMQSTTQARGIGQGLYTYAQDNDGRYPDKVSQLVEGGYISPDYVISPDSNVRVPANFDKMPQQAKNDWIDQNSSFKLLAGGEKAESLGSQRIVGYMNNGPGASIARGDGSAAYETQDQLHELLGDQLALNEASATRSAGRAMIETGQAFAQVPASVEVNDFAEQQSRVEAAKRRLALKQDVDVSDGDWALDAAGLQAGLSGSLRSSERFARGGSLIVEQPDHALAKQPAQSVNGDLTTRYGWYAGRAMRTDSRAAEAETDAAALRGYTALTDERKFEPSTTALYDTNNRQPGSGPAGGAAGGAMKVVTLNRPTNGANRLLSELDLDDGSAEANGPSITSSSRGAIATFSDTVVPESPPATAAVDELKAANADSYFSLDAEGVEMNRQQQLGREAGVGLALGTRLEPVDKLAQAESSGPAPAESDDMKTLSSLGETLADRPTDKSQITSGPLVVNDGRDRTEQEPLERVKSLGAVDAIAKAERVPEIKQRVEQVDVVPRLVTPPPPAEEASRPARKAKLLPVNPWVMTAADRLSTFALDVDTASYDIARRYIDNGFLPPKATVRMEEFVNSFDYNYPAQQSGGEAFGVYAEGGPSPFDRGTVLLKIGVRGKVIGRDQAKPANLVFVIDTSGSMAREDRLPLVRKSLALVLDQLSPADKVSLVSYGTGADLLIEAEPAKNKQAILDALENLQTGGATNLLSGVELGYEVAQRQFITNGVNRVILNSDGVANVGPSEADQLVEQAKALRQQGVSFTSVGFGAGNYDDRILEQLADTGDGDYLFVGSLDDAKRVFVDNMAAIRPVIAYDAKVQVDFDPARVRRYRLIGYENREIADQDFRNDTVDAGEVGSGQSATALYELELNGPEITDGDEPDLGTVYVRYRDADTGQVREIESRLTNDLIQRMDPAEHPRFYLAAGAARFAEVLRGSEHLSDPDVNRNLEQVQNVVDMAASQLPLDKMAQELRVLAHRAEGLPRAE